MNTFESVAPKIGGGFLADLFDPPYITRREREILTRTDNVGSLRPINLDADIRPPVSTKRTSKAGKTSEVVWQSYQR